MKSFNIGCYISPNVQIQAYIKFLDRLENITGQRREEEIVAGDFNVKATEWVFSTADERGQFLVEVKGGKCRIKGNAPTFLRGG